MASSTPSSSMYATRLPGVSSFTSPLRQYASPEGVKKMSSNQTMDNDEAQPAAKRSRTARACMRCRGQKLKCSGNVPCERCTRLHVTCRASGDADGGPSHERMQEDRSTQAAQSAHEQSHLNTERQLVSAIRRIATLEASVDKIVQRLSGETPAQSVQAPATAAAGPSAQFPAPFSDVAFDRKTLENRQATRANTPVDGQEAETQGVAASLHAAASAAAVAGPGRDERTYPEEHARSHSVSLPRRKMGTLGAPWDSPLDPISTGIISIERATTLVTFFFDQCHASVPLFDVRHLPTLETMRRSDLYLLCAILAIASRYSDVTDPSHSSTQAEWEREDLCQVAEAHLGRTLVSPRHRLGDVQATILLHAYSLRSGGTGLDPWIISGHAFRLAKRLSVDRVVLLQPGQDTVSTSLALPRRTWLLLCASDCFPSLGFGRPASPRENLDSCVPIINLIAQQFERQNEGNEKGELDEAEFFIASQVELATISRRLLDWVAQTNLPVSQVSDLRAVAHKYDMLVDQLDTSRARWSGPSIGTADQWCVSRLFRLHVRLCLATFTMRLCETAMSNGKTTSRSKRGHESDDEKGKLNFASKQNRSGDQTHDRSREIANRLQVECRESCLQCTSKMIDIHKKKQLKYVPDYLITALAQAVITSLGILETQKRGSGQSPRQQSSIRAQEYIDETCAILSHFTNNQTGLAVFLLDKLGDRARRSSLIENAPPQPKSSGYMYGTNKATPAMYIPNGYNLSEPAGHASYRGPPTGDGRFADAGARTYPMPFDGPAKQAGLSAPPGYAPPMPSNSYAPPMPFGPSGGNGGPGDGTSMSGNTPFGSTGQTAEAVLQWAGGLPQLWTGDDPLQFLFGIGMGSESQWPSQFSFDPNAEHVATASANGSIAADSVPGQEASPPGFTTGSIGSSRHTGGGGGRGHGPEREHSVASSISPRNEMTPYQSSHPYWNRTTMQQRP